MLGTDWDFAYMRNGAVQLNPQGGPGFSFIPFLIGRRPLKTMFPAGGIIRRYLERVPQAEKGVDVADIARLARGGQRPSHCHNEGNRWDAGRNPAAGAERKAMPKACRWGQISKAYPLFGPELEKALEDIRLTIAPAEAPTTLICWAALTLY